MAMVLCAALGACASVPSTGPSAHDVVAQAVRLETVTPDAAAAAWAAQVTAEQHRTEEAIAALGQDGAPDPVALFPGARLTVTLWTEPSLSGMSEDLSGRRETTTKSDLGVVVIDGDGAVTLPFVGRVQLQGLNLSTAADAIRQRFRATHRFQAPQIAVNLEANPRQQIIVSGSANHPTVVNWREGGVGLGEAITQAGGSVIYEQGQSRALTANHVIVVRAGVQYDLPLKAALESAVQLRPGDQVLLQHQAIVNIQCLGGGWPQNTVQSFDETPTLARVVAAGGGLSSQQAQGAAVFVLSADRKTIYRFPWNSLAGLQAAQAFPLRDGDILYIATAPIVRIQQVANILFSAAYPIATARSLF